MLASLYCADWRSRDDTVEYLQAVIDDVLKLADPEELMAHGFVEADEDGCLNVSNAASAEHVLRTWSAFDISHYLVRPSLRSVHHYPSGAVMFPLRLQTTRIRFLDCQGNHFDDLPGELVGQRHRRCSTDDIVEALRGDCEALWFMNLTDPTHSTGGDPGDTVYVYSPRHLTFHLTGRPVEA